jgi:hypothetical protein
MTPDLPTFGSATSTPGFFGSHQKKMFRNGFQPAQNRIRNLHTCSNRACRPEIRSSEHPNRRKIENETPSSVPALRTLKLGGRSHHPVVVLPENLLIGWCILMGLSLLCSASMVGQVLLRNFTVTPHLFGKNLTQELCDLPFSLNCSSFVQLFVPTNAPMMFSL